jgi:hypothetical protein
MLRLNHGGWTVRVFIRRFQHGGWQVAGKLMPSKSHTFSCCVEGEATGLRDHF